MSSRERHTPDSAQRAELRFLAGLAQRRPDDPRILKPLGDLYTACGIYEEGLAIDLKLARLRPREPEVWYNLGCSYALLNQKQDAVEALAKAVELGYADAAWMSKDEDLASLREDPVFQDLIQNTDRNKG